MPPNASPQSLATPRFTTGRAVWTNFLCNLAGINRGAQPFRVNKGDPSRFSNGAKSVDVRCDYRSFLSSCWVRKRAEKAVQRSFPNGEA